jgi:competence protein ComEA
MKAAIVFLGVVTLLGYFACTSKTQSPEQVKEKTAQATSELKQNVQAVAQGVKEGWNRDRPLDINAATKDQLMSLPGMTAAAADRVIAGRPYTAPGDLVNRHVLSQAEYSKIADRITAKK